MNISYSAIDLWRKCTFSFKLRHVDKIPIERGSLYSCFGTAIHGTVKIMLENKISTYKEVLSHFKNKFQMELKEISRTRKEEIFQNKDKLELFKTMIAEGPILCFEALHATKIRFPEFEIIQIEQEFSEPILFDTLKDWEFKGVIDLVIKTPDGFYHIIDWKTCTTEWDEEKRNSVWVRNQLVYYKHYFSLLNNIDRDKILCHFALLKCLSKKISIEILDIPVEPENTIKALKVINNLIYNTEKNNYPKNRLSCKFCDYYKTQWCP